MGGNPHLTSQFCRVELGPNSHSKTCAHSELLIKELQNNIRLTKEAAEGPQQKMVNPRKSYIVQELACH